MTSRSASHAGSWYTASPTQLADQLDSWLKSAQVSPNPAVRAIIAPHAGYSYSGPAAAWAYGTVDPTSIKTVFILGPSHHVYIDGCALTECLTYKTPCGDLAINTDIVRELHATGKFKTMSLKTDEDEHSIEMHLPYVHKIMSARQGKYTIVPILVGATKPQQDRVYGELLAPYLRDPSCLFVISSDFCHWGQRFQYTYRIDTSTPIHQSIQTVDTEAMTIIESGDSAAFDKYLKRTRNTICGRHPISLLLCALEALSKRSGSSDNTSYSQAIGGLVATTDAVSTEIRFVHYAQSSKVLTERESSVSYASAFVAIATAN